MRSLRHSSPTTSVDSRTVSIALRLICEFVLKERVFRDNRTNSGSGGAENGRCEADVSMGGDWGCADNRQMHSFMQTTSWDGQAAGKQRLGSDSNAAYCSLSVC
jgi:hypothetical protein